MSSPPRPIAVLGAYGHTGRFIVGELLRRDMRTVACGRNAQRLDALSREFGGIESRAAVLDDPASLDLALAGCSAVINAAGPFLDSARPVAEAALRAGIHYLDLAAEQGAARMLFEDLDPAARKAGVALLPSVAFFGGLADLLASAAMGDWQEVDAIDVAVALDSWRPTLGTRRTGARNTLPRMVVAAGQLSPLPQPAPTRSWSFPPPFGTQQVVMVPLSEIVLISRHLPAQTVNAWMTRKPLEDLADPSTSPPVAADADGRSAQRFVIEVRLRRKGRTRSARAEGRDIYAVSAPLVVEALHRLLEPCAKPSGALAVGQLFKGDDFLRALEPRHLQLTLNMP